VAKEKTPYLSSAIRSQQSAIGTPARLKQAVADNPASSIKHF
jgi:hypothetical protein